MSDTNSSGIVSDYVAEAESLFVSLSGAEHDALVSSPRGGALLKNG